MAATQNNTFEDEGLEVLPEEDRGSEYAWRNSADLPASFRYAAKGFLYTFKSQRNFRIHIFISTFALLIGLWIDLSLNQLAILVLTIAAVLILELLNTSIEAVVDLTVGRAFHPLARIAKDCAAASVLVASFSSLLIGGFIILPNLLQKLGL